MTRSARAGDRFHAAFGSHPRPVLLIDRSGLVAANDAACIFLGFSEPALVEAGLGAIAGDRAAWTNELSTVFSGEEVSASWMGFVRGLNGRMGAQLRATAVRTHEPLQQEFVAVVEIDVTIDSPQRSTEARQARQRYERLVDSAQEGIWEVDTAGTTVFANWRMGEILGCEVKDLIGRSMFDFFDPDLADLVRAQFAVIAEGRTDRFDAKCRRVDGTTVWLMASAVPLFDADGTWTGAAATAMDVTDRRAQEEALRGAEELLRRTFDGAPIGMALVGLDGRWERVNDAACQMLGRDRQELLSLSFQDITHPDDLETDMAFLAQTLAGERSGYAMEKRYVHQSGETVWAMLTVGLVRDDAGRPLFFVSQFEDITARRAAEAAADRAQTRTRRVLDRAAIAMAIIECDGTVTDCNQRFLTLLQRDDFEGDVTVAAGLAQEFSEALPGLLITADLGESTVEIELSDGVVIRLMAARLDPEPDSAIVVQALDVTHERREHRRLTKLAELDPLTQLVNRRGLGNAIGALSDESRIAVLYIDLDGFKTINDALGHRSGDRLLVEVAAVLSEQVRHIDVVARMGGDEFAVVLLNTEEQGAALVADRILRGIDELARDGAVTASIGIACGSPTELTRLVDVADRAMLEAKSLGKHRSVLGPSAPAS